MEKNNCYIYWDDETVKDQKVYVQCEGCFQKNKKGLRWPPNLIYGYMEIKCSHCNTIIYKKLKKKKKKKKKGEDEATI